VLVKVVDGDTVDLDVDVGFRVTHRIRVRLAGYNAPEVHNVPKTGEDYQKGVRVSEYLKTLLEDTPAELRVRTYKLGIYARYSGDLYIHYPDGSVCHVNQAVTNFISSL